MNVGQVVGTYNSPGANTCALIRVYWNNTNGYNHLRLWWGTSGSPSIIPASALFDPSVQPAAGTCTQSISSTSPSITLTKNVASRAPGDQFTIQIADDPSGSSVKKQGTTSGTGLGDQESIALVATAGSICVMCLAMPQALLPTRQRSFVRVVIRPRWYHRVFGLLFLQAQINSPAPSPTRQRPIP